MRQIGNSLIIVAASVALMLLLRLYVFGVYQSAVTLRGRVDSGDYVVVNKLDRCCLKRSDLIAFRSDSASAALGVVVALPGDTISLRGQRYVIPKRHCWQNCGCHDCGLYLLETGAGRQLVLQNTVTGKAYRLWRLPWQ